MVRTFRGALATMAPVVEAQQDSSTDLKMLSLSFISSFLVGGLFARRYALVAIGVSMRQAE